MTPFQESEALTLGLGVALFFLIEALFIIRQATAFWARPDARDVRRGSRKD